MQDLAKLLAAVVVLHTLGKCGACDPDSCWKHPLFPKAAGCLITNGSNRDLLLVKNPDGEWTFPAGNRAGIFENGRGIAERETKEEAGIDGTVDDWVCSSDGILGIWSFVGYCCTADNDSQAPSPDGDEVTEAKYMSRSELAGLSSAELRFPDQQDFLLSVIDGTYC